MADLRVVVLVGSLRERSFNKGLALAAAELAPAGSVIQIASIRGIPIYDGDLEAAEGAPAIVEALKQRIVDADALLLASPEYNNSVPGPLKNAIDWLSRPPRDIPKVFGGRPVGVIGATPGRGGTRLAQNAWLPVFRTLGMRAFFEGSLYVDGATALFDPEGRLIDPKIRELLARYLEGFVAFARRERS